jgi:hypothetical protein
MVITSKRRRYFAAENDFTGMYKHEKIHVSQTVKSGKNKQTIV